MTNTKKVKKRNAHKVCLSNIERHQINRISQQTVFPSAQGGHFFTSVKAADGSALTCSVDLGHTAFYNKTSATQTKGQSNANSKFRI